MGSQAGWEKLARPSFWGGKRRELKNNKDKKRRGGGGLGFSL